MNDECCEVCGGVMVYRSTNNVTHKSKWKCKECGHVQLNDYVPFEFKDLPKKEPKHYTYSNGRYDVKKRINGYQYYLAGFKSEDAAKKFVSLMKECDWQLDKVAEFKEACNV